MYFLWIFSFLILGQTLEGGRQRLLFDLPDYCLEQFRCGTQIHLMCMHQMKMESKFCGKMQSETDQQLRQEIFHRVNAFRQIVAGGGIRSFPGGASNMRLVSWDYELEKMAKAWTSKYVDRLLVGENFTKPCTKTVEFKDGANILAYILGPDDRVRDVVGIWTKKPLPVEMAENFQPDSSNGSESYDEYATIVWAETHKMGCSITSCNPHGYQGLRPLPQVTMIACLFGPKGNSPGQKVFKNGTACSDCPPKTKCKWNSFFPKLCALEDDFDRMDELEEPHFPVAKLIAFLIPLISIISLLVILMKSKFDSVKQFLIVINESHKKVENVDNLSQVQ